MVVEQVVVRLEDEAKCGSACTGELSCVFDCISGEPEAACVNITPTNYSKKCFCVML